MENKILTICIAAYNVSKYIEKTIESLLISEIIDDIEILVIDDGATDNTIELVSKYQQKYQNSIRSIHKENGGYGTVVNLGIELASGKYFKLLDGDDWVDNIGFLKLINDLKQSNSDMIFTRMYNCFPDRIEIEQDSWSHYYGKKMKLSELEENVWAGMWEITVKTSLLKQTKQALPSKCFYTDHLYLMLPLPYVSFCDFHDYFVYCYRLGNSEQSVSIKSRIAHVDDIIKVSLLVSDYCNKVCLNSSNYNYALMRSYFCAREAYFSLLLDKKASNYSKINKYIKNIKAISRDTYVKLLEIKKFRIISKLGFLGFLIIKILKK